MTAFENDDIPPKGFSLENVHLRKSWHSTAVCLHLRESWYSTAVCLHLRQSWHGTANIEVPRPTYLEVLCTAKNLGTACTEPAPFTLSEFAVSCRSDTRTKKTGVCVEKFKAVTISKLWKILTLIKTFFLSMSRSFESHANFQTLKIIQSDVNYPRHFLEWNGKAQHACVKIFLNVYTLTLSLPVKNI